MTDTTKADTPTIIAQLRMLVQLTQNEMQIAQIRVAQASTDAVRRELTQNSRKAGERLAALQRELRHLGGVPDVITPVLGRVGAVVKANLEQAGPLDEALLQDLALEHQLLDRATYLKVLAQTVDLPRLVKLAERLITAHNATVEWLTVVLAETALGGPAALRATPFQRIAGGATRAMNLPGRFAAEAVNRTVDGLQQTTEQARQKLLVAASKATQLTGAAKDVLTVGRDASLQRAETLADRKGDTDTARSVRGTRRNIGALRAAELPVKNYDQLNVTSAVKAIKSLKNVGDVRAIVAYEQAHSNRHGVVSAGQTQVAALAKEAVNAS